MFCHGTLECLRIHKFDIIDAQSQAKCAPTSSLQHASVLWSHLWVRPGPHQHVHCTGLRPNSKAYAQDSLRWRQCALTKCFLSHLQSSAIGYVFNMTGTASPRHTLLAISPVLMYGTACTAQHSTAWHSTLQHRTVLHSTARTA